jgi:hypothetical protein
MDDPNVIKYDYSDVPTIWNYSQDNTRIRALMGPFGSGKSSGGGVMEIIKRACEQIPGRDGVRRTRAGVIRNTNRELSDTTMKTWDHWMARFGHLEKTQKNFQLKMAASDGSPVECEVMFRPLDDPDDVDNLLSLELSFAWFNEVREIAKLIFDSMLGRVGRYPAMVDGGCTWSGIFGDTNPPDTDSWFYNLFEEERPLCCPVCLNPDGGPVQYTPREIDGKPVPPKCPNCERGEEAGIPLTAIFKQPSGRSQQAENLKNLPKGYYSNMMVGKDAGWITVYVDGKYGYVRDGKPVYPNWSDHFHLVPNIKAPKELEAHPSYPLICGWDCTGNHQGWTINQRLPNSKFCTYDELFAENTDARTFLTDVVKPFMWGNYMGIPWSRIYVIMDPASKRSDTNPSNAKKEAKMLNIDNVFKAFSNSWDARYGAVNRLLMGMVEGGGMYQLNRRCKILHKGFLGEYKMERKQVSGKEIYKDQPVKNKAADLHDALQYAAMGPSREEEEMGFHGSTRDHSSKINLGAHL